VDVIFAKKLVFVLLFLSTAGICGCKAEEKIEEENLQPQTQLQISADLRREREEEIERIKQEQEEKEKQEEHQKNEEKQEDDGSIGTCTTELLSKTESRINNIQLAAQQLDNIAVEPGEEFSFNKELGKRTTAKGYEKAPIIIKTEEGPKKGYGVGGGICQISSTLYNAVYDAGLKVTERHSHSKNVGYLPRGKDAAVTYGGKDFKFVNTRDKAITIKTYLSDDYLTVKIFENGE